MAAEVLMTTKTPVEAQKNQCLLTLSPEGDPCFIPLSERTAALLQMAMLADRDDFTAAGLVIPASTDLGKALKDALTYLQALPAEPVTRQ